MKLVIKKSECKKNAGHTSVKVAVVNETRNGMTCGLNYCIVVTPLQESSVPCDPVTMRGLFFAEGFSNN